MSSTFGKALRITTFGESHGKGVGVVIDGFPSNFIIDITAIQNELDRRKPGQSAYTTSRQEPDLIEIYSGVFEGKTTGAPIMLMVRNKDAKPQDYDAIKEIYRPSHADFTYQEKFGIRDLSGGGRASARALLACVAAGALAKAYLHTRYQISINAWTHRIGEIVLPNEFVFTSSEQVEKSPMRCPDADTSKQMENLIEELAREGDSIGGIVACRITNVPIGIGEPMFDKLHANLGKAILSINACKGFEYGSGFECAKQKGSEHNDAFWKSNNSMRPKSNNSGGIQGGISNGEDIYFKAAFKPTPSIAKMQETVNVSGEKIELRIKGRHDPCIIPRAIPIVEAMSALAIMDLTLRKK